MVFSHKEMMGNTRPSSHLQFFPRERYLFYLHMSKRVSPAKAWCFTLNNYTKEEHGAMVLQFSKISEKNPNFKYIVGKEVGEQGTPHLQGYIQSNKKFRPLPQFKVMRDNKQAMHFERAKGNAMQNFRYCSKDGDFVSNMDRPYMNEEEAQKIWDEPDIEIECEWACSKEDYNKYIEQQYRKERAAQVLISVDFTKIYEQRNQDS